jgi:hypothetical protein
MISGFAMTKTLPDAIHHLRHYDLRALGDGGCGVKEESN